MKTKRNKLTDFLKTGIFLFAISLLLWNCEQDESIDLAQEEFSVPSITQAKDFFQEKTFSKNIHSKSNKQLDVLWEQSIPKEFKENINILYTPINFNSSKRFKSLIASVKIDNQIQSYILTLVYDENSNNKQFSGHIFKHDSKGNFVEAYQYHKGNHIKTFKESNNNKIASRGGGCTTSIFEIVALAMSGWDPGTVLDCVEVGGNSGGNGSSSSTFDDWSTPSSNIKNPIGWSLGSNNNLGSGSGGDFGDPNNGGNSNSNSNGEELNLDGVEPWWAEDDKIINELTGKAKCVYDKLKKLNLFKATIKKFENSDSYNLIIEQNDDCKTGIDACTNGNDIANGNIKINLRITPHGQPLNYAASLLHEGIHAELFKYVDEHQKGLDPNERKNLLGWYFRYKGHEYQSTIAQHQHMADKYVKPIAQAIRKLDNYSYPLEYYMCFGWDGLTTYGYDKYYDNGKLVLLDKSVTSEYNRKQKIVNDNTKLNGNECK